VSLRYSPRARRDIDGIHDWIAKDRPRAATAVVAAIRKTAALLADYPRVGRETDIPGVRMLPVGRYPYLVYYKIADGDVVVVHVRHGARNRPKPEDFRP